MTLHRILLVLPLALACAGAAPAAAQQPQAEAAPAAAPATLSVPAGERPGDFGQRWQVEFDNTAQSDGRIVFHLWQYDEQGPTEIVIPVKQGDTRQRIAVAARDIFRRALPNRDFNTNLMKNNIFVTAKLGERRFSMQTVESSAAGVDVDLYREGR